jgi:hypothetical protein
LGWCAMVVACSGGGAVPPVEAGAEAGITQHVVSGVVVDSTNATLGGAKVQVCNEALCTLGNADASGAFRVAVPDGTGYHVIAHAAPVDVRVTSAGRGIVGDVNADVVLSAPIVIPVMGAKVLLDGDAGVQTCAVTSDLTLTVAASDLELSGDAFVAGASVTTPFAIAGKTVLGVWALAPWGTHTSAGKTVGLTIANNFGLAPGDSASVYAVSELTAAALSPSSATVNTDGTEIIGASVDRVTWVVLTR